MPLLGDRPPEPQSVGGMWWEILLIFFGSQAAQASAVVGGETPGLRPPRITEQPSDVLVRRHEPATLNCKAEGAPPPAVDWYHNGQLVPRGSSANRMVLPSGALFFLHVVARVDTGSYWCVARNELGRARSRNASLEIAVLREEFRVSPRLTVVAAGHTATLECGPPRGHPEPSVRWKKDGDLVNAGTGRIRIVGGGNLVLDDVRPADGGSYRCVAENVVGLRESAPALLTVQVPPRWVRRPEDVTARVGQDVGLSCEAVGEPPPLVSWQRERTPQHRSEGTDSSTLLIPSVSPADEGAYICEARNPMGSIKAPATLTVLVPPQIAVNPRRRSVEEGGDVRFSCTFAGKPQPMVFWRKEGDLGVIVPRNGPTGRPTVGTDGSLEVPDVESSDEGHYLCSAVSPLGSATARVRLEVLPSLPSISLAASRHGTAWLPPCPGRWHFQAVSLPDSVPRMPLRITNIRETDAGLYTCVTSTEDGVVTSFSVALTVTDSLQSSVGPPSKPSVLNVTETAVTFKWEPPPTDSATVLGYRVEYQSGKEPWKTAGRPVSGPSYQLAGLRPDTRHVFLVRAETALGPGPPSPPTDPVRTLGGSFHLGLEEAREHLGTLDLTLTEAAPVTSTAVRLSWKVDGVGELVEGFHIWYRQPDLPLNFSMATMPDPTADSYLLTRLEKFSRYEFFLVPFYRQVEGPPSNSRSARTMEDVPSRPPDGLTVLHEAFPTAHISWNPLPTSSLNGILKGYVIQVMVNGTHLHSELILNASTTSSVLVNITSGSVYEIRVRGFTSAGQGPFCSPVVIRLDGRPSSLFLQPWVIGLLGGIVSLMFTFLTIIIVLRRRRRFLWNKSCHLPGSQHKSEDGSLQEALWFNQAWRPPDKNDHSLTASEYAEVDTQSLAIFYQKQEPPGPYATTSLLPPWRQQAQLYDGRRALSDCTRRCQPTELPWKGRTSSPLDRSRSRTSNDNSGSSSAGSGRAPKLQGPLNWVPPPPPLTPPPPRETTLVLKAQRISPLCPSNSRGRTPEPHVDRAVQSSLPSLAPYHQPDSGGESSDTEVQPVSPPSSVGGDIPTSHRSSPSSSRDSTSEGSYYGDGDNFVSALTNVVLGPRSAKCLSDAPQRLNTFYSRGPANGMMSSLSWVDRQGSTGPVTQL